MQPEQGVKVSKIVGLTDDIKLNLAATDIRIEAPIPGKAAVGIEVPNKETSAVALRDLLESDTFQKFSSNLAFAVGKDIAGHVVVTDIVGGAMSGNCVMGSDARPMIPSSTMNIEITVDSTGLLIKVSNFIVSEI